MSNITADQAKKLMPAPMTDEGRWEILMKNIEQNARENRYATSTWGLLSKSQIERLREMGYKVHKMEDGAAHMVGWGK